MQQLSLQPKKDKMRNILLGMRNVPNPNMDYLKMIQDLKEKVNAALTLDELQKLERENIQIFSPRDESAIELSKSSVPFDRYKKRDFILETVKKQYVDVLRENFRNTDNFTRQAGIRLAIQRVQDAKSDDELQDILQDIYAFLNPSLDGEFSDKEDSVSEVETLVTSKSDENNVAKGGTLKGSNVKPPPSLGSEFSSAKTSVKDVPGFEQNPKFYKPEWNTDWFFDNPETKDTTPTQKELTELLQKPCVRGIEFFDVFERADVDERISCLIAYAFCMVTKPQFVYNGNIEFRFRPDSDSWIKYYPKMKNKAFRQVWGVLAFDWRIAQSIAQRKFNIVEYRRQADVYFQTETELIERFAHGVLESVFVHHAISIVQYELLKTNKFYLPLPLKEKVKLLCAKCLEKPIRFYFYREEEYPKVPDNDTLNQFFNSICLVKPSKYEEDDL